MISNIQDLINEAINRKRIYTDTPECRCGNKNLFHFSGYVFECDDCNITIILKKRRLRRLKWRS